MNNYQAHRTNHYDNTDRAAMIQLLKRAGWIFRMDHSNPNNDYTLCIGWWVNPQHPVKCELVGDSKPMRLAAEDTVVLYTDITPEQVIELSREIEREDLRRLRAGTLRPEFC